MVKMTINIDETRIAELISEAIGIEPEVYEDEYRFQVDYEDIDHTFELNLDDLGPIVGTLSEMEIVEETAIYNGYCYEVLIRQESRLRFPHRHLFGGDGYQTTDVENELTYSLSAPTEEYLIFLLNELAKIAPIDRALRPMPMRILLSRRESEDEFEEWSVLRLLRRVFSRILTLRIDSTGDRSLREFLQYADSFIFQISYNLDMPLVPERYLEDLVRTTRISSHRRGRLNEIDPPRRKYTRDLIHHYQMAVASESPPLEYLSFYHVLEHYFEAVFEDDLINKIRDEITQPDFSYRRKRDIRKLINKIKESIKLRAQNVDYSEEQALFLTISKYIDINRIIEQLNEYDKSLLAHYKSNTVSFSNGSKVNLESNDQEQIIRDLSRRIYRTRNAIVHSKEGERGKFVPFEHDKILIREVPLLRFLAESVIIETSKYF